MKNSSIWKVLVSGAIAIGCIFIFQAFWLIKSYSLAERTFDEKVRIGLIKTAEQISRLTNVQLPSQNLISQLSQDYYVVNIKDAIDPVNLEFFLVTEFQAVALNTDFEYGIYDCNNDEMVYGNYINSFTGTQVNREKKSLPRYGDYVYYFGVRFPGRLGYLVKEQWIPLLFSILLLFAVLFFVYASYEILRQKKLSELQKDFIDNMTHEFKTPLTNIKISAEVLASDEQLSKQPRLKRYSRIIGEQAAHLDSQVDFILQNAMWRNKRIQLRKVKVDLNDSVNEAIDLVQLRTKSDKIFVVKQLLPGPQHILADVVHLKNLLQNILENAIKYADGIPHIFLETKLKEDVIELLIKDKGIGIPKSYHKNIFNPFFRVPTGNLHNIKGFGLGLFYVKRVCHAHGWAIRLKSDPGSGTSIYLGIPKYS